MCSTLQASPGTGGRRKLPPPAALSAQLAERSSGSATPMAPDLDGSCHTDDDIDLHDRVCTILP